MLKHNDVRSNLLRHHGIKGQKWGVRNGPPYPLGVSDHSASERKAGWRKSLDKSTKKKYNESDGKNEHFHLTDQHKKAIKIGTVVVATTLATYGAYRLAESGKLDQFINIGKSKATELLGKKVGSPDNLSNIKPKNIADTLKKNEKTVKGLKKLSKPESLSDTLKRTNPLRSTRDGKNNCTYCSITAFLRRQGYDVTAKSTGGEQQILNGVVENCFRNATVLDGSAVRFGRSREDAAEMLLKRFGKNAEGVCCIQWKNNNGGHAFNWMIENGIVSFFDAQNGWDDDAVSRMFWKNIDPQGYLQLARLDNAEVILEAIKDYVE